MDSGTNKSQQEQEIDMEKAVVYEIRIPGWRARLSPRGQTLVEFAENYYKEFSEAGAVGSFTYAVMAQMAKMLDEKEA